MIKKNTFLFLIFLVKVEASTLISSYIDFNGGHELYNFFFSKLIKNEPIIADERVQIDLSIFSGQNSISLVNFLKEKMNKSETAILVAMLNAPLYNIDTILDRQTKIKYIHDLICMNKKGEIDRYSFKNIKSESALLSFIFSDDEFIKESDIVNTINLVKNFSYLLVGIYEYLADDNTFLSVFKNDIGQIKRFHDVLKGGNNPFIEVIKEIMQSQFSNKRLTFRLQRKKKS